MSSLCCRRDLYKEDMTERGWIQGFVRVNSSCVRLNSTVGWEGGIYFFNLGIIYEFFGEQINDVLPTYELGWVPEGYEIVDVYQDDRTYSAIYQRGNDVFVLEYGYEQHEGIIELRGDIPQYTVEQEIVVDKIIDLYISKSETESNLAIWIDESTDVVFMLNCYFEKSVILNIIEQINLVK